MSKTFQFLIDLGEDANLRRAFAADRVATIGARELGDSAERALLQGDGGEIRVAAGANGAYLPPKVIWAAV